MGTPKMLGLFALLDQVFFLEVSAAHPSALTRTRKEQAMTIYRYEILSPETVDAVNRLLVNGWKPVREVPLGTADSEEPSAAIVLERDDTTAVALSARLGDDVPLELLQTVPLLDGLTHEELAELVSISEIRRVPVGEVIFDADTTALSLCVILQGEVELRLASAGSAGEEIMQIGERDVFGESSFFSGGAHAVQAFAATDARLLVVPRDGYDDLLQASRPAAWRLAVNAAGILGVRLQDTDEWLSEILQHEEDARISQSWQRFRESTGRGGFKANRFFGS